MKGWLILLPIFIFALIQGAFLSLNLVLLGLLVWSAFAPGKQILLVAFVSGLIFDLTQGTPLGVSSFIFLVFTFILYLYSRRFSPSHPLFLTIFVFFSSVFYSLITNYPLVNWLEGLVLAILALIFGFLGKFFLLEVDREKIKLKI